METDISDIPDSFDYDRSEETWTALATLSPIPVERLRKFTVAVLTQKRNTKLTVSTLWGAESTYRMGGQSVLSMPQGACALWAMLLTMVPEPESPLRKLWWKIADCLMSKMSDTGLDYDQLKTIANEIDLPVFMHGDDIEGKKYWLGIASLASSAHADLTLAHVFLKMPNVLNWIKDSQVAPLLAHYANLLSERGTVLQKRPNKGKHFTIALTVLSSVMPIPDMPHPNHLSSIPDIPDAKVPTKAEIRRERTKGPLKTRSPSPNDNRLTPGPTSTRRKVRERRDPTVARGGRQGPLMQNGLYHHKPPRTTKQQRRIQAKRAATRTRHVFSADHATRATLPELENFRPHGCRETASTFVTDLVTALVSIADASTDIDVIDPASQGTLYHLLSMEWQVPVLTVPRLPSGAWVTDYEKTLAKAKLRRVPNWWRASAPHALRAALDRIAPLEKKMTTHTNRIPVRTTSPARLVSGIDLKWATDIEASIAAIAKKITDTPLIVGKLIQLLTGTNVYDTAKLLLTHLKINPLSTIGLAWIVSALYRRREKPHLAMFDDIMRARATTLRNLRSLSTRTVYTGPEEEFTVSQSLDAKFGLHSGCLLTPSELYNLYQQDVTPLRPNIDQTKTQPTLGQDWKTGQWTSHQSSAYTTDVRAMLLKAGVPATAWHTLPGGNARHCHELIRDVTDSMSAQTLNRVSGAMKTAISAGRHVLHADIGSKYAKVSKGMLNSVSLPIPDWYLNHDLLTWTGVRINPAVPMSDITTWLQNSASTTIPTALFNAFQIYPYLTPVADAFKDSTAVGGYVAGIYAATEEQPVCPIVWRADQGHIMRSYTSTSHFLTTQVADIIRPLVLATRTTETSNRETGEITRTKSRIYDADELTSIVYSIIKMHWEAKATTQMRPQLTTGSYTLLSVRPDTPTGSNPYDAVYHNENTHDARVTAWKDGFAKLWETKRYIPAAWAHSPTTMQRCPDIMRVPTPGATGTLRLHSTPAPIANYDQASTFYTWIDSMYYMTTADLRALRPGQVYTVALEFPALAGEYSLPGTSGNCSVYTVNKRVVPTWAPGLVTSALEQTHIIMKTAGNTVHYEHPNTYTRSNCMTVNLGWFSWNIAVSTTDLHQITPINNPPQEVSKKLRPQACYFECKKHLLTQSQRDHLAVRSDIPRLLEASTLLTSHTVSVRDTKQRVLDYSAMWKPAVITLSPSQWTSWSDQTYRYTRSSVVVDSETQTPQVMDQNAVTRLILGADYTTTTTTTIATLAEKGAKPKTASHTTYYTPSDSERFRWVEPKPTKDKKTKLSDYWKSKLTTANYYFTKPVKTLEIVPNQPLLSGLQASDNLTTVKLTRLWLRANSYQPAPRLEQYILLGYKTAQGSHDLRQYEFDGRSPHNLISAIHQRQFAPRTNPSKLYMTKFTAWLETFAYSRLRSQVNYLLQHPDQMDEMLLDPFSWAAKFETDKRSKYLTNLANQAANPQLVVSQRGVSLRVKTDEAWVTTEPIDTVDTFDTTDRPRLICPGFSGECGWTVLLTTYVSALTAAVFPEFATGCSMADLAIRVTAAADSINDPVAVTVDYSAYDSTRNADKMAVIDHALLTIMKPFIRAMVSRHSDKHYQGMNPDHLVDCVYTSWLSPDTPCLYSLPGIDQIAAEYGIDTTYAKKVAKKNGQDHTDALLLTPRGTVLSGKCIMTTWGNTISTILEANYNLSTLVSTSKRTLLVAGDDHCLITDAATARAYKARVLETTLRTAQDTTPTGTGNVVKSVDMGPLRTFGFCSKTLWDDDQVISITRNLRKALVTKQIWKSSSVLSPTEWLAAMTTAADHELPHKLLRQVVAQKLLHHLAASGEETPDPAKAEANMKQVRGWIAVKQTDISDQELHTWFEHEGISRLNVEALADGTSDRLAL